MPGTPLRGRDEQLAVIGTRLDRAVAGRGSVVLVEGRPGLGKTGLLAAAARTAAERGFAVGAGTASPAEQAVPMAPVLAALVDGAPPVLDARDRAPGRIRQRRRGVGGDRYDARRMVALVIAGLRPDRG